MEKLTLEDRIQVYRDMLIYLNRIDDDSDSYIFTGFCWMVDTPRLDTPCLYKGIRVTINDFPEIIAEKPDTTYSDTWWFNRHDYKSRIAILEKILSKYDPSKESDRDH